MRKKKKNKADIRRPADVVFPGTQVPKHLVSFLARFQKVALRWVLFPKTGPTAARICSPRLVAVVDCTVEALGPDNDWRAGRERGRSLLTPSQVYFGYCGRHYTTGGLVIPRYRCPVEVAILPNPDPRRKKQKTLSRPVRYVTLAPQFPAWKM